MFCFVFFSCMDGDKSTFDTMPDDIVEDTSTETENLDSGVEDTAEQDSGTMEESTPCHTGMALIQEQFCMDMYEASIEDFVNNTWEEHSPFHTPTGNDFRAVSKEGVVPQAHISGDLAKTACTNSGKRLCTSDEWLVACRGSEQRVYPYGMNYISGACNDVYTDGHPVIHYFGTSDGIWDSTHMNDPNINQQPNSLAQTGAYTDCVTPDGIHDLHGNIHEWVADETGVFRGGFYADASINGTGCQYKTSAHNMSYYDYSTGFRCCADKAE